MNHLTNQEGIGSKERVFYQSAKKICRDLFEVRQSVYWIDFCLSAVIAYSAVSIWLHLPVTSPLAWMGYFVGAFGVYRASMFVHEIVHLSNRRMPAFRRFWNLFAGVPMMVPSFTYESHIHHHSSKHYGTQDDGEYLPLASGSLFGVAVFLAQIFFQPLLVMFRYLIWTPISFTHPQLRKWTLQHASSLVINFKYENHQRPNKQSAEDTFWEIFTALRAWLMIGLVMAAIMPPERLLKLYGLTVFILAVNHIRTLAAHRYTSDGTQSSHLEQFFDSTNITGNVFTELLCPLGLRYHALHHLFPRIPYYNLGTAHRRLLEQLPENSPYRDTVYPGMTDAIGELLQSVRNNNQAFSQHPINGAH